MSGDRSVRLERLRWRIAYALNRLPNQCWTYLALWALYASKDPDDHPWWHPWNEGVAMCRTDAAECGSCYCGKLQNEEGWAREEARVEQYPVDGSVDW